MQKRKDNNTEIMLYYSNIVPSQCLCIVQATAGVSYSICKNNNVMKTCHNGHMMTTDYDMIWRYVKQKMGMRIGNWLGVSRSALAKIVCWCVDIYKDKEG